ncbi:hypothetical protein [Marimonas lutisalis]|uniref:hypothetical protein n=1 Tax=Marimonas lutisalis TaxID=2545756 RepID=UPI0010F5B8AC|nr:hypothetical protein [Marimonas lutisalis]
MSDLTLTKTRMKEGVWEGLLRRDGEDGAPPQIVVTLDEQTIPGIEVIPDQQGGWGLRVPVPLEAIGDGVQTFLIREKDTADKLGAFTLIAGEAIEDDIRAEMDLLRAELDMLKRAFRRHCLESM